MISNSDPLNQGRVQVRFDWQLHDTTDWIRVMTPDAGSSDKVSKNRGFMAIPEVGDQVMVDFIHDNPDRPFVLGGMFHGKVGGGGGASNIMKSLSSRSGNKLELNDGEGSVFLTDQGGANMKFDGAGNAVTNTNNNKTVMVGNDNTKTVTNNNNNNTTSIGCKHITDVGKGKSILKMGNDGVIDLNGTTKVTLKVGGSSIEITGDSINITSQYIRITGTEWSYIKGSSPAMAIFDGSGNTFITGTQVDIN